MDERGWGWTTSEVRQARLVAWLAPAAEKIDIAPFYQALPDWLDNGGQLGDTRELSERGLIDRSIRLDTVFAEVTPAGQGQAETWQATRADRGERRAASRDAMVAWLYARDATSSGTSLIVKQMPDDPRHGVWLAEPFNLDDVDAAAAWLYDQGLIAGTKVSGRQGSIRAYLTAEGVVCAENFGSNTRGYTLGKNAPAASGPTVHIDTNHGPFQVAGDHAHQVQNIGASAEHLREMITSVAELVRQLVPDAKGIDAQQQAALNAAGDGAVDQSALRRFRTWVLSVVQRGATAALVPAVTSATDDVLREAARIASHLG